MNGLKIAVIMAALMALFLAVGHMVGGQSGMVFAFILAAAMNVGAYWFSDKLILKRYHARLVKEADHPLLYRVVHRVTSQAGMPVPKIYIVPTRAPNAFATGRNKDHAAVAVTEGLLTLLSEDELEGVIGHEMAHIQNKDMLIGTITATFAGAIGMIAAIARWGAIFGGYGRDDKQGGMIGILAAAIVAPLVALILQTAISRQREYKADATSGQITGKYLPLATALEKLHRSPVQLRLDRRPSTAHLMIVNPLSGRGLSSLFSTHPPAAKRIERLKELSQQAPYG